MQLCTTLLFISCDIIISDIFIYLANPLLHIYMMNKNNLHGISDNVRNENVTYICEIKK